MPGTSAASVASAPALRAVTATRNPCPARRKDSARPIPELAPVTQAIPSSGLTRVMADSPAK